MEAFSPFSSSNRGRLCDGGVHGAVIIPKVIPLPPLNNAESFLL